jgi:hypothetical protein
MAATASLAARVGMMGNELGVFAFMGICARWPERPGVATPLLQQAVPLHAARMKGNRALRGVWIYSRQSKRMSVGGDQASGGGSSSLDAMAGGPLHRFWLAEMGFHPSCLLATFIIFWQHYIRHS